MGIDAAIVAAYLALLLWVGFRAAARRRAGLEDYVLAGRRLTLPMFVAALVTSFYGGVLGIGEFAWTNGLCTWLAMDLPYYVFAGLYASFLCGRIRLSPGMTIPDHLERAYGRPLALLAAGLVFLLASPADELLMAGTLLSWATGVPAALAMAAAAAAALAYMLKGGLRADVWTARLGIAFMYAGFFVILPFARMKLGGLDALRAAVPATHLSLPGTQSGARLAAWFFIALWTLVDPSFHQRCAAADSPAVARKGIWVSIAFWAVFDMMTMAAGLYAKAAMPKLEQPLLAFPKLADLVLPPVARGLFLAGLTASILAALQAKTFISAISLAKDGVARWKGAGEREQELWTRWAVVGTSALAFVLALAVPSVVGLWWALGSAVVPGLLLPMLGAYWPAFRVGAGFASASSLAGWVSAMACLAAGSPFGIEPIFVGLALSAAVWTVGLAASSAAWTPRRAM
jgi:SSS family solute:Na+ symporter